MNKASHDALSYARNDSILIRSIPKSPYNRSPSLTRSRIPLSIVNISIMKDNGNNRITDRLNNAFGVHIGAIYLASETAAFRH